MSDAFEEYKVIVDVTGPADSHPGMSSWKLPRETWTTPGGVKHRSNGPAVTIWLDAQTLAQFGELSEDHPWKPGQILVQEWYRAGRLHRDDGPARISYEVNGVREEWYRDGELHRDDGPAELLRNRYGFLLSENWSHNGLLHREGAPAVIMRSLETGMIEFERWSLHGLSHRVDGPALVRREEPAGIAVEEEWAQHGKPHRVGGPAEIYRDEQTGEILEQRFYLNGVAQPALASAPDLDPAP